MNMRKHDSSEGTNGKIHSEQFAPSGMIRKRGVL
jgi:hypothetical protein